MQYLPMSGQGRHLLSESYVTEAPKFEQQSVKENKFLIDRPVQLAIT